MIETNCSPPAESPTTICQSNYNCSIWLCLKMYRVIYQIYPTKSIQINIVIGGKPPNPHLKSYFINQSGLKKLVGGFCSFTQTACRFRIKWSVGSDITSTKDPTGLKGANTGISMMKVPYHLKVWECALLPPSRNKT